MDRHPTQFTRLSQFTQAPDRSLGRTCYKFRYGEEWNPPPYLAVAAGGWYGEGRALEIVWLLFPLIAVEGLANRFYFCKQDLLRCGMRGQVVHRIDKVLSRENEDLGLVSKKEGSGTKATSSAFPMLWGVNIFSS